MPRSSPHSLTLFSLLPCNKRAKAVTAHSLNARFTSTIPDGTLVLDIGAQIRGTSSKTLAVIGRGVGIGADIIVEGPSISKIQCSFEVDWDTGVVMLYDRSLGQTTNVSGKDAIPFESGRIRKIVVGAKVNTIISMGRENDSVEFRLHWYDDLIKSKRRFRHAGNADEVLSDPALAWTIDTAPTEVPPCRETRLHTPGHAGLNVRYVKVDHLGSGRFGKVYKAIDVDSGMLMAVKILQRPHNSRGQMGRKEAVRQSVKREIEILSKVNHPNIVNYITSQGWFDGNVEIFMGLKEGTLETLIDKGVSTEGFAEVVFCQMLQALDCIAFQGIIHRDLKPENILFTTGPNNQYQFQLGDFGLCNQESLAATISGTPLYMAPEINKGAQQSCKADVWSLFVTMMWVLDTNGFRNTDFRNVAHVYDAVSQAVLDPSMSQLKDMALRNPIHRASAAQMLVLLFHGKGLITPRRYVASLNKRDTSAAASMATQETREHQ